MKMVKGLRNTNGSCKIVMGIKQSIENMDKNVAPTMYSAGGTRLIEGNHCISYINI